MEAYHLDNQPSEASLSYTIITKVAEFKETEAETLQPPLHKTIDPEALDALFIDGPEKDRSGKVSFVYSGCHIVIEKDGQVHVQDVEDNPAVGAKLSYRSTHV